jgi:hypothetical protein
MRNLKLVDAVIALHDIRRLVEEECGTCRVSIEIGRCADQLHELSLIDNKSSKIAQGVIEKAKE